MEWILYIVGGIFLLGVLAETGILSEFFTMFIMVMLGSGIGAFICWMIADKASPGDSIGLYISFGLYLIFCILRIIAPNESTLVYEDGTTKRLSDRGEGIAGIVMLVIFFIISIII